MDYWEFMFVPTVLFMVVVGAVVVVGWEKVLGSIRTC